MTVAQKEALTGLANLIIGIDGGENESARQVAAFNFLETLRLEALGAEKLVTELEQRLRQAYPSDGARAVADERRRQMTKLGWTPEEDDKWTSGQLASAAIAYLLCVPVGRAAAFDDPKKYWPWGYTFKPETDLRNLEKAGALIAAEIDRRKRAGEQ